MRNNLFFYFKFKQLKTSFFHPSLDTARVHFLDETTHKVFSETGDPCVWRFKIDRSNYRREVDHR